MVCDDKRRALEVTWFAAVVLSVCYVITAIVMTARLGKTEELKQTARPVEFAAIWSILLLIGLIAGGTMVFKRISTPIATGTLLGATGMFSQIELLLFAIFTARSKQDVSEAEKSADSAMAAFAFFLAFIYGVFTLFLYMWRSYLPQAGPNEQSTDSYA